MIEYVKYRSDKFDDVGTQCEDLSSYHVLNFYKFYGASDIIEQDTVFLGKRFLHFHWLLNIRSYKKATSFALSL
jgi:hypothetical protein